MSDAQRRRSVRPSQNVDGQRQVHAPGPTVPSEDTLAALRTGSSWEITGAGALNFPAWLLAWSV
jgi:hypothetical protein